MAKNAETKDFVKPITIRNTETNEVYILEYNRDSIRFAESQGFKISELEGNFSMSAIEDLFYFSFRMHHMKISRDKAMKVLYDDLGGMPDGMLERLIDLYAVPLNTLVQDTERKNSKMTVEF